MHGSVTRHLKLTKTGKMNEVLARYQWREQQLSDHETDGEKVKEIQIVDSKKEIIAESKEKQETN